MDPTVRDADWSRLTAMQVKREAFSSDARFFGSLHDARDILGSDLYEILHCITLLAFKPEAYAGRRIAPTLRFMKRNGFTPIISRPARLTHRITHEIWRYQWNAATLDKIDLSIMAFGLLPTFVLVLRSDDPRTELPASVRLKALKGAADPRQRRAGTLRCELAAPNRMITFVHSTDEPADVIRELGILFIGTARRELYRAIREGIHGNATESCWTQLAAAERVTPETDFEVEPAWQRVLATATSASATALERQYGTYQDTGEIDWPVFRDACLQSRVDPWDMITIGTDAIVYDKPGHAKQIDFGDAELELWCQRGAGPHSRQ